MKALRVKNIQRKEKLTLIVNGKEIEAYRGESLLAALMAAGYKNLKKSPVRGEPRGALCGMGVCFECLVSINGIPNLRSCLVEVEDNLEIKINEQ
ncbi:MAG: (2Fe-2S)-binding protein [Candidatus Aminicenantes bacterium]|nr:(2Fe-2S)-binding protein [Candidatus Aminicenantes bacterium]